MNRNSPGSVELRDLIDSRELHDLIPRHVVSMTSPVHDLAFITDIEDIASVGPDTVILLSQSVALGGWMISSALRYAWERRACALIVPEQSLTDTVIELAKRLGMSLLTTNRDMTRLSLEVAIQIGVARAGSVARIQALTDRVSQAPDLDTVVAVISRELAGARVQVTSSGSVVIASAGETPGVRHLGDSEESEVTRVEARVSRTQTGGDSLVADVTAHARPFAEQALAAAVPSVRALLSETRLKSTRDSLPLITIAALTGSPRLGEIDPPALPSGSEGFRWPISDGYVAVCILSNEGDRLGGAVHQSWGAAFPDVPLARFSDGWLAFVPVRDGREHGAVISDLQEQLVRVRALDLKVGVSPRDTGPEGAAGSVRKAWLAARLAGGQDLESGALVEFDRIPSHLLGRLLPIDLAEQLAAGIFPDLLADPAADELIQSVVAYLSARGSITVAATTLRLHRNTVQARIRRAEELGVRLTDPDEVLPAHILLTALSHRADGGARS